MTCQMQDKQKTEGLSCKGNTLLSAYPPDFSEGHFSKAGTIDLQGANYSDWHLYLSEEKARGSSRKETRWVACCRGGEEGGEEGGGREERKERKELWR